MDGEWEAPQIPNPACETAPGCGEWKRPTINNPKYKGKWKAPLVDNPNYQVTSAVTRWTATIIRTSLNMKDALLQEGLWNQESLLSTFTVGRVETPQNW